MNIVSLPANPDALMSILADLFRRSVDGTVVPLFVDYANSRVLIGANAVSTTTPTGKLEITGDIKVLGGGNGIILPCRNGKNWGRVILENPDSNGNIGISVDRVI